MKEATKQSVSILMITLVAAVAIFVLNKMTLPAFSEYQKNRAEILDREESLAELKSFADLAADLNAKYNTLGGDLYKIAEAIPSSPQFSGLLAALDTIARMTNVTIGDMAFRDISKSKYDSDDYSLAEVSLNINGSYENISLFFSETEKELRLMDVVNISMKKIRDIESTNNKRSVAERVEANVIIQAYYQE